MRRVNWPLALTGCASGGPSGLSDAGPDRGRDGLRAWRDGASRVGRHMAAPAWPQPSRPRPSATGTPRTLVAGLARDGPIAPLVLDGAMDRDRFGACVTNQRAPAVRPGQIVVAAKLSSHRSTRAPGLLRAEGNDLIFPAPCSPDLNPVGMTVSKLKTLIRKAAARTCQALRKKLAQPATGSSHNNAETASQQQAAVPVEGDRPKPQRSPV